MTEVFVTSDVTHPGKNYREITIEKIDGLDIKDMAEQDM